MYLSVITPILNEEKNIPMLMSSLREVLSRLDFEYEIIAINDGSQDKSIDVLKKIASEDRKIKIIDFQRNFGQTAALSAGFDQSKGKIIIPIDSDLENDPEDIPKLIEKLNQGYDVVSGWRKGRWKKNYITRKLPSLAANWIISRITQIELHDYGCTLKAYRREVLDRVKLYGEMHRFIPVFAAIYGARVTEVVATYQPRKYGKSNYNLSRIFKVITDLVTVLFLSRYFTKPMHFFGQFGLGSLLLGFITGGYAIFLKLFQGYSFISTPLPLLTVVLIIIGIQFVLMGLLAEVIIRTYFESQDKKTYIIKERINLD